MIEQIKFPTLFTERLHLRQLEAGDVQAIFQLRSNRSVNRFLERKPAKSRMDARLFIEKVNSNFDENQGFYWGICLKSNDQLIGTVCFFDFVGPESTAEIGYELHPSFQGKGFMAEAINSVIGFARQQMNWQKILAFPDKQNLGSIRVLEKCQFIADESYVDSNYLKFVLPN